MAGRRPAGGFEGGDGAPSRRAWEPPRAGIKIFEIFEGTSEVQRLVIARHVLGG